MTSSREKPEDRDSEARLRALVERGFRFVHPTDADGELAAVVGVRVHDNVVDVVKLHDEDDVLAMRIPGSEADVLSPRRTLWQSTGYVCDVLDEVLALPDEAAAGGQDANGCWVPVRPGSAKWVTADA